MDYGDVYWTKHEANQQAVEYKDSLQAQHQAQLQALQSKLQKAGKLKVRPRMLPPLCIGLFENRVDIMQLLSGVFSSVDYLMREYLGQEVGVCKAIWLVPLSTLSLQRLIRLGTV